MWAAPLARLARSSAFQAWHELACLQGLVDWTKLGHLMVTMNARCFQPSLMLWARLRPLPHRSSCALIKRKPHSVLAAAAALRLPPPPWGLGVHSVEGALMGRMHAPCVALRRGRRNSRTNAALAPSGRDGPRLKNKVGAAGGAGQAGHTFEGWSARMHVHERACEGGAGVTRGVRKAAREVLKGAGLRAGAKRTKKGVTAVLRYSAGGRHSALKRKCGA